MGRKVDRRNTLYFFMKTVCIGAFFALAGHPLHSQGLSVEDGTESVRSWHLHLRAVSVHPMDEMQNGRDFLGSVTESGFGGGADLLLPHNSTNWAWMLSLSYMQPEMALPQLLIRVPYETRSADRWHIVPMMMGLMGSTRIMQHADAYATVTAGATWMQPPRVELGYLSSTESLEWESHLAFTWSVGIGFIIADHVLVGVRHLECGEQELQGRRMTTGTPLEEFSVNHTISMFLFELGYRI